MGGSVRSNSISSGSSWLAELEGKPPKKPKETTPSPQSTMSLPGAISEQQPQHTKGCQEFLKNQRKREAEERKNVANDIFYRTGKMPSEDEMLFSQMGELSELSIEKIKEIGTDEFLKKTTPTVTEVEDIPQTDTMESSPDQGQGQERSLKNATEAFIQRYKATQETLLPRYSEEATAKRKEMQKASPPTNTLAARIPRVQAMPLNKIIENIPVKVPKLPEKISTALSVDKVPNGLAYAINKCLLEPGQFTLNTLIGIYGVHRKQGHTQEIAVLLAIGSVFALPVTVPTKQIKTGREQIKSGLSGGSSRTWSPFTLLGPEAERNKETVTETVKRLVRKKTNETAQEAKERIANTVNAIKEYIKTLRPDEKVALDKLTMQITSATSTDGLRGGSSVTVNTPSMNGSSVLETIPLEDMRPVTPRTIG
jgi:hypothetical protein